MEKDQSKCEGLAEDGGKMESSEVGKDDGSSASANSGQRGTKRKRRLVSVDSGSSVTSGEASSSRVVGRSFLRGAPSTSSAAKAEKENWKKDPWKEFRVGRHSSGDSSGDELSESDSSDDSYFSDCDDASWVLRQARKSKFNCPPNIVCPDDANSISFNPKDNTLAVGSLEGKIYFYSYSKTRHDMINSMNICKDYLRVMEYNDAGTHIYTGNTAGDVILVDVEGKACKKVYSMSNKEAVFSMKILDDNVFVVGGDSGTVVLLDKRQNGPVSIHKDVNEAVTSMQSVEGSNVLACTTNAGYLLAYDIASKRLMTKSRSCDADMTCSGLFRSDTKLVVGNVNTQLLIFDWNKFDDWSDEYPIKIGRSASIYCMVPITENLLIIGLDNYELRAVHLFPMKHVGLVGRTPGDVISMDISCDGNFIAAASAFDRRVALFNINYFANYDVNKFPDLSTGGPAARTSPVPPIYQNDLKNFFSGLDDPDR